MSIGFSGLGSGLDTESMVKELMQLERRPIQQLQQQQQDINTSISAWKEIEGKLSAFQEKNQQLSSSFDSMAINADNEEIVTVSAETSAIEDVYDLTVVQLAQTHSIASDRHNDIRENKEINGTFYINGADITITNNDSLIDIRNLINENTNDVTASIVDNRLVLTSTQEGANSQIDLIDDTETKLLQKLGLLINDEQDNTNFKNELREAQDSIINLNGIEGITRSSNVLDDVLQGVTLTLEEEGSTSFSVAKDLDSMVKEVNKMIESYNGVQEMIQSHSSLNATLQGDSTLNNLRFDLRQNLTNIINVNEDESLLPSSLGIEVDRHGVATVNETKLRQALEKDFSQVKKTLFATHEKEGYSGIQERLNSRLDLRLDRYDGSIPGATERLENRSKDIDKQIENLNYRMGLREKQLRDQFLAMERAVSQNRGQASWLEGQFSQLSSSGLSGLSGSI
ncbi:MAG: flagellar filament capping protein FliD [bacterium]